MSDEKEARVWLESRSSTAIASLNDLFRDTFKM
jgi:hypothetical protein